MENVDQVIADISAKTEKKVIESIQSGKVILPKVTLTAKAKLPNDKNFSKEAAKKGADIMMEFMQAGNKEFEERTGRPMTYAEMRAMYG